MSMVMVRGYVPHTDFGEIPYVSFIYNVEMKDGKAHFLVWNPVSQFWEVVPSEAVRPVAAPTQDVPYNKKVKEYGDWLKEREIKNE